VLEALLQPSKYTLTNLEIVIDAFPLIAAQQQARVKATLVRDSTATINLWAHSLSAKDAEQPISHQFSLT